MISIKNFHLNYKIFAQRSLLWIAGLLCSFSSFAQPSNDDPCAAATLPVTATCSYQTFTNVNATLDAGFPFPGCADFTGASFTGTDIWFQFTVPAGGTVIINTQAGTLTDGAMAIYSGDCNVMTLIECDDDDGDGAMPYISRSGLTPGSVILIRFWKYPGTLGGVDGNFGICVATPPPAPANDNCAGAINVPVNTSLDCTQFVNGSTISATQSSGVPAPTCGPGGVNDDVWFSFVATGASHTISLTNVVGQVTDMAMSVYSGASCAVLTQLQCSDPENMGVVGLTSGQTYYIRVWTYTSVAGSFASFRVCVGTPPPPPANDNCSGAVPLAINADLNCTAVTPGTTLSALPSTGIPDPTCGAAGANDDVWFSFVAANAQHTVSLLDVTGNSTDLAMSVYSGASCGALTHLQCSDPNNMTVAGLTVGQLYYVRVWTWSTTAGNYGNFNICVGTPPPPPSNDNPCNAIALTVSENGTCNFQQFTNASATATAGVPAPGCASYDGGDVWFTAVVPCSGSIILDSKEGVILDAGMAIYRGTCSNLSLITCDDDGSNSGAMSKIVATGLTPGETLWVRVWEYDNDNNGTFSICAQAPPPPPPAATCQTAQSFCTSSATTTIPNITGQPNENGAGVFGCLTTIPNPTYYYLQIQNTGNIQITIRQTNNAGTPVDVDFIVWGPFATLNATCGGISANNIIDCGYSTSAVETVDITNAVAGQYYLFLVTNFSDEAGTITYQQTGGNGSSNCSITCTLSASNGGVVCAGRPIALSASNVANATYLWTGPNCFTSTQQNPVVPVANAPLAPGQYVYTVTAITPTGQACQDTTIVTVSPRPFVGADTSLKICSGSAANLSGIYNTTGLVSTWTIGGNAVANPAAVSVAGIYRLVISNSAGCTDTAFVTLATDTVRSELNVAQVACTETGRITVNNLSGIAPYTYSISSNAGVFQSSNEFVVPAGNYIVTTRDSLGCTTANQANVMIVPELTVYAGADVSIVTGETTQLQATVTGQPASISWTPSTSLDAANVLNPRANPATTTTYTINVTNSLGCIASDDVTITVIPYCVKVQNAFTPNGDGINDSWEVYDSYNCLSNVSVIVFNRYGKKVFESRDYRNKWQGTFENKPIPDGTYYGVLEFTFTGGKKVSVKTDLTIVR